MSSGHNLSINPVMKQPVNLSGTILIINYGKNVKAASKVDNGAFFGGVGCFGAFHGLPFSS